MSTTFRRALVVLAPTGLAFALGAGPAAAHVTVSSPDAAPGGWGKLVFRVPNESDTASTTKLQVTLPADTPFASVLAKPVPGWRVQVDEAKLPEPVTVGDLTLTDAVRRVTWTAQPGQGIDVDMFGEFEVSVGPFPEQPTSLLFPAVQTYGDGEVVRWAQPTPPDGAEPEHPAPALELTADGAEASHADADASDDDSDSVARTLGAGGLVLGAVAVGGSLLLRRRQGGD